MSKSFQVRKIAAVLLTVWLLCAVISASGCGFLGNENAQGAHHAETPELIVRFLDVGQGDSCLISLPTGETMLIDAGSKPAGKTVSQALEDIGVQEVDYFILTHPHEDHIGGAVSVLEAFEVGEIFMPRTSHTTVTYEKLLNAINDKGLSINEAKKGEIVIESPLVGLEAGFLGPQKRYDDLNDMSAVLFLKYDSTTFLFTGDICAPAEKDMLEADLLSKVDVLKVAHHGSNGSTGAAFLKATAPSIAVISVGEGNSYGHPGKALLERLDKENVRVFRTDIMGTVVVTSDGKTLQVSQEAGE